MSTKTGQPVDFVSQLRSIDVLMRNTPAACGPVQSDVLDEIAGHIEAIRAAYNGCGKTIYFPMAGDRQCNDVRKCIDCDGALYRAIQLLIALPEG